MLDKHSLFDLGIFNRNDPAAAIFAIVDHTKTQNGRDQLRTRMQSPIGDYNTLQATQAAIRFIAGNLAACDLHVAEDQVYYLQHYLKSGDPILYSDDKLRFYTRFSWYKIAKNNTYTRIIDAARRTLYTLDNVAKWIDRMHAKNPPQLVLQYIQEVQDMLATFSVRKFALDESLPQQHYFFIDHLVRVKHTKAVERLLTILADWDALYALATFTAERQLVFPKISLEPGAALKLERVYHVQLKQPVKNDFSLQAPAQSMFLTGANMTGKSTLLRAVSQAIYFAHLGMGVPAMAAQIPFIDHLYIAINKTDDLQKGYSHFMQEIQRVKEVIAIVKEGKRVMAVFDELFSGTNQDDAQKCLQTVLQGLSGRKNGYFIFSSHLTSLFSSVSAMPEVSCYYMDALVQDEQVKCNYILQQGVAKQQLGWQILVNEGIPAMLTT
ncbi:MutS-like protein [Chitinophaga skermanii]|uniref:MutS-like protein n=1 Tax=Chitinophaga skermanii TaxID=331697 RepID=A0A327Q238_9BACT|nr:hypothetical protein [Chitinophaga skermanii]RAI98488.1 MutS-like protein [Chitinophaga skermanii]